MGKLLILSIPDHEEHIINKIMGEYEKISVNKILL